MANRVSATLAAADKQAVIDAIGVIRKNMPFLIDLSADERRDLAKMGDKSEAFVSKVLEVVEQNPALVPAAYNAPEFRRDWDLFKELQTLTVPLSQLAELVDDTMTELSAELYAAALVGYALFQATAPTSGLDVVLDDLAQRFARRSEGTTTTPTPPVP